MCVSLVRLVFVRRSLRSAVKVFQEKRGGMLLLKSQYRSRMEEIIIYCDVTTIFFYKIFFISYLSSYDNSVFYFPIFAKISDYQFCFSESAISFLIFCIVGGRGGVRRGPPPTASRCERPLVSKPK